MVSPKRVRSERIENEQAQADPGRDAWTLLMDLLRDNLETTHELLAKLDLTSASANLLRLLEPDKGTTMVALAKGLRCHDSNVTGLVDRLETRGLIERRLDAQDRRVKLVVLTRAGRALRQKLLAALGAPPAFIRDLSPDERMVLLSLLRKASSRGDQ
jgi:MarR family transcriptional regulator, organic hydroperoxide resistance regulator